MKHVRHRRHRHSQGPGHYRWGIGLAVAISTIYLCYLFTLHFFDGLSGALLMFWMLAPILGGAKVGMTAVMARGLSAVIGVLFLLVNFWLPYLGYFQGEEQHATLILLFAPAVHWMFVFTLSVVMKAMNRR